MGKQRQEQSRRDVRRVRPLDPSLRTHYVDNLVINSRYTWGNFIFKNLYEQFRRPLNFYFLMVAMLQFISVIAPVNPLSTLLPLLFAFSLTAVKEGYDDVKRHRQDFQYNNKKRQVLDPTRGQWASKRNADIVVGDILLLSQGDDIPCDVVVLGSSSTVFIRTDNLDGEIDLKPRDTISWSAAATDASPSDGLAHHRVTVCAADMPPADIASAVEALEVEAPPPSAIVESFDGCANILPNCVSSPLRDGAMQAVKVPLTHTHLLPQSCTLQNTAHAIVLAVYTGDDTKCGMNKRPPPVKWAQVDKDVSRYSVYIFICQMISAFSFGVTGYSSNRNIAATTWYLQQPSSEATASFLIYPLRFFLLTTVMIPVSFKFVVDVCKYYMANCVEWDDAMIHRQGTAATENEGCKVKNSSILEDLGQIDYVLTDKTGTLTKNVMELVSVTVCPSHSISLRGALQVGPLYGHGDGAASIKQFGQFLALCNTVEVVSSEKSKDDLAISGKGPCYDYRAASPDEVALCRGAERLGVQLIHRDEEQALLRIAGHVKEDAWVIHHVFPFSSEKKSMGVIVEHKEDARIWFIVKGADDRILSMAGPQDGAVQSGAAPGPPLNEFCSAELVHFARDGLRTLLVAVKEMTRKQLHSFLGEWHAAQVQIEQRDAKLDQLRFAMEQGVSIVGITAIEDKLQDDVQETISDMLLAGIRVWMLTGDKVETAEQIGLSCGLRRPRDRLIRIAEEGNGEKDWRDVLLSADLPPLRLPTPPPAGAVRLQGGRASSGSVAGLVALGREIYHRIFTYDARSAARFSNMDLLEKEAGRVSVPHSGVPSPVMAPLPTGLPPHAFQDGADGAAAETVLVVQGGRVLETILSDLTLRRRFMELSSRCRSVICARTTPSQKAGVTDFVRAAGYMTLSVGDGGNDVAMLQEAHVGVGIAGLEGQQAARAADFAITQFSDLRPLLFVHGQQAYIRTAYVIKYSFYKSMLISFIQLAYNVLGTHVSGGTFWNSFSLTMWNGVYTLPQTIFYCMDRCAPRVVLERNPQQYKLTRASSDMNIVDFFANFVLRGIVQSVVLLGVCTLLFDEANGVTNSGRNSSNDVTFTIAYSSLMVSQLFIVLWESHSVTFVNAAALVGMPVFYFFSTLLYSGVPNLQYYQVFHASLSIYGLLSVVLVSGLLVMPLLVALAVREFRHPSPRDTARFAEVRRQHGLQKLAGHPPSLACAERCLRMTPEAVSGVLNKVTPRVAGAGVTAQEVFV